MKEGDGANSQNVIDLVNNHVSLNKYEKVLKLVINLWMMLSAYVFYTSFFIIQTK